MPLQNRVDPFGELLAVAARGSLMGNRGGRIHDAERRLGARRWSSRQWICCRLDFNGRHRNVWGTSYTELFFLDEPTALAAGHRPCFECRRGDAKAFAESWQRVRGLAARPSAAEMDRVLHAERLNGGRKRVHTRPLDGLPDGAFIAREGLPWAIRAGKLLRWTASGYDERMARPRGIDVDVLTPPAIVAVLADGYRPQWHSSAERG